MARLDVELARLRDLIDAGGLADGRDLVGVEVEFHLIDAEGRPSLCNTEVLGAVAGGPHDVQTELARFNVELNLPPTSLHGTPLTTIGAAVDAARAALSAAVPGTSAVTIGILPTITGDDIGRSVLSDKGRYHELDDSIMEARGGTIDVDIDGLGAGTGDERLQAVTHSVLLEAAATSLQVHLDLPADGFVDAWNAAQAIAALQVAVAANAPTLLGRRLWHETRIPLFEQLIDVRTPAERAGIDGPAQPPRVWFGACWIEHPVDLFAENVAHFRRPLVGRTLIEDDPIPAAETTLELEALVLHNTTVWRWNRPVYAVHAGRPSLRVENRVLSAPPTSTDGCADMALFLGLVAGLREHAPALTEELAFADAAANFQRAARDGLGAELRWPGHSGPVDTTTLLRGGLLDVAAEGLDVLGVPGRESGPALDTIAERVGSGRNGAAWQLATLAHEEERHDRPTALRRMLLRYLDLQEEGTPVHRWPWPPSGTGPTAA
jgi:gamma-glutamyl:cysteine ligase YbdK (ATP-grasp superfamily)